MCRASYPGESLVSIMAVLNLVWSVSNTLHPSEVTRVLWAITSTFSGVWTFYRFELCSLDGFVGKSVGLHSNRLLQAHASSTRWISLA